MLGYRMWYPLSSKLPPGVEMKPQVLPISKSSTIRTSTSGPRLRLLYALFSMHFSLSDRRSAKCEVC